MSSFYPALVKPKAKCPMRGWDLTLSEWLSFIHTAHVGHAMSSAGVFAQQQKLVLYLPAGLLQLLCWVAPLGTQRGDRRVLAWCPGWKQGAEISCWHPVEAAGVPSEVTHRFLPGNEG